MHKDTSRHSAPEKTGPNAFFGASRRKNGQNTFLGASRPEIVKKAVESISCERSGPKTFLGEIIKTVKCDFCKKHVFLKKSIVYKFLENTFQNILCSKQFLFSIRRLPEYLKIKIVLFKTISFFRQESSFFRI